MHRRTSRLTLATRARQITAAEVVGAEERAAALDVLGHAGFGGIEAGRRSFWVANGFEDVVASAFMVMVRLIEIGAPFPDVAGHVVQAIAVGRKRADGSRTLETVLFGVLIGKAPL